MVEQLKLASNSRLSCLSCSSAGISDVHHHTEKTAKRKKGLSFYLGLMGVLSMHHMCAVLMEARRGW